MKFWIIYKLPHETTWLTMSTDTKEKMNDFIKCKKQSGFEAKFSHVTQKWNRPKDAVQPADPNYHEDSLFVYC